MTTATEAIYTNGVLKPVESLDHLREQQRVRILIETVDPPAETERRAALERFRARVRHMNFRSTGPYPNRDELHKRC